MRDSRRIEAEKLFQQAADLAPGERRGFLEQRCGTDPDLRGEVESLLGCLEDGQITSLRSIELEEPSEPELVGRQVGPYELVELLGEGGFGAVYRAKQHEPIRREVAIKVIKLGMDTRQVIARFGAERQALAMMDHPNIARVLDAGATESGRPYFVMELVRGVPITEYCDGHGLDLRQRLELFAKVCHAVQHAHLKGIIHRDIKPSNVLVAEQDGEAVPKVIDFGIAKATAKRLTELTHFTEFHQFVGTPEYMSPEQAELGASDIDTRTDVYSLGVMLYVLVTGITPLETTTLAQIAFGEIQRLICEVDPPTPSQRVSKLGEKLADIARSRSATPQALRRSIRGELDWIVMKALEKERNRRYETAAGLAEDICRHLDDQPVLAGPPSTIYKVAKFVRRHRVGVLVSTAAVATLLIGFAMALAGFLEASAASAKAEKSASAAKREAIKAKATNAFLGKMLAATHPDRARGREVTIRYVLDEATRMIEKGALAEQPEVEAAVRFTLGNTYTVHGLYSPAGTHLAAAVAKRTELLGAEHPETLRARSLHGAILRSLGRFAQARETLGATLAAQRRVLGAEHSETLETYERLAITLWRLGGYAEAETIHRDLLAIQRRLHGDEHSSTLRSRINIGTVLWGQRRIDEAAEVLEPAVEQAVELLGESDPDTLRGMNNLGLVLEARGAYPKAEELFRRTWKLDSRILGVDHPGTEVPRNNLARVLASQGKTEAIRPLELERLEVLERRTQAPSASATDYNALAWRLLICEFEDLRQPQTALELARRAAELSGREDGTFLDTLACAQNETGDGEQALATQREAVRTGPASGDPKLQAELEMNLVKYLWEQKHDDAMPRPQKEVVKQITYGLGKSELDVGGVLEGAAWGLLASKKPSEAEAVVDECVELLALRLPADHWRHASVRGLRGEVLAAQERYAEAEEQLLASHAALEIAEAEAARKCQRWVAKRIVALYEAWERPEQAATWRKQVSEPEGK